MPSIGQALLDVPFPEMIRSMGLAVAEAQYELDLVGMKIAQMMAGRYPVEEEQPDGTMKTVWKDDAKVDFGGKKLTLLELGFTPTFYQFVDTLIEVKVSISMSYQRNFETAFSQKTMTAAGGMFLGFGACKASVSSVSASFASKYQYSAEGSSLMRTKLVTVPTPAILEERIRLMLEAEKPEPPTPP
jgi:hypothetical protein